MTPRLSHTKSRTGCFRCKARKIKCDEQRPVCRNCGRHNATCKYPPNANASASKASNYNLPASGYIPPTPVSPDSAAAKSKAPAPAAAQKGPAQGVSPLSQPAAAPADDDDLFSMDNMDA